MITIEERRIADPPLRKIDQMIEANRRIIPAVPQARWYLPWKMCIDRGLGLVLLLVLSPVILVSALIVKLTSRGPAFYLQTRVGKDGRLFRMIKLRSMRHDAESLTGAIWSHSGDNRVTVIGKILRATHIDEFPQLINVLRGEMSLVEPRPERPEFVKTFETDIEFYALRHTVRPGIMGIAQLRLPADSDLESVRDKLEFDLYYVRHLGPRLDIVTLVATGGNLLFALLQAGCPSWMTLPSQLQVRREWNRMVIENGDQAGNRPETLRLESPKITRSDHGLAEAVAGRVMSAS